MSGAGLSRVTARTGAEVASKISLEPPAQALLRPGMTPRQFLDALIDKRQFQDAIRFLAHALPRPEAVWWACVCAKEPLGPSTPAPAAAAVQAAEKWVSTQTDENRRAAFAAADKAGLTSPAGCAALAAFLSGGSLAPPNIPAVPPAEGVCAQAVAGAVVLSVFAKDTPKAEERFKAALTRGVEVANGTNRWR